MAKHDSSQSKLTFDEIHQKLVTHFEGLTCDEVSALSISLLLLIVQSMEEIEDFFTIVTIVKNKILDAKR